MIFPLLCPCINYRILAFYAPIPVKIHGNSIMPLYHIQGHFEYRGILLNNVRIVQCGRTPLTPHTAVLVFVKCTFYQTSPRLAAIRQLPNWSLQPGLPFNLSADIQFRQNHWRPISTNLWWSILLFQSTSNKRIILTLFVSNITKEVWHFGEMCPGLWNKQVNYWNCQNCFGFQLSI